jgi:hypothetical protein
MNTDRLERLLWERLDGTISGNDLIELGAVLAEHPEPRELEREIAQLAEELDELDTIPPPAELRNRIDRALADATAPEDSHRKADHSVAHPTWQRQWLPLAASVMIGVAIGYLIHPGFGANVEGSRAAGVMFSTSVPENGSVFEVDLGDGVGTVSANGIGSTVVVDAILTGSHETLVSIEAANGALSLVESSQFQHQSSKVWVADEIFSFSADGPGTHHFVVVASETTEVEIFVMAEGKMITSRTISLENEPERP